MNHKILSIVLTIFLVVGEALPIAAQTMNISGAVLPILGQSVQLSQNFTPVNVRGIILNPHDPLQFDFIVDTGDKNVQGEQLEQDTYKLVRYFLAGLAVKEEHLWVNLSPFEQLHNAKRIVPLIGRITPVNVQHLLK